MLDHTTIKKMKIKISTLLISMLEKVNEAKNY